MNKIRKSHIVATVIAMITMALAAGSAWAGGFLDVNFEDSTFSEHLVIDNPYWPLNPVGGGVSLSFT